MPLKRCAVLQNVIVDKILTYILLDRVELMKQVVEEILQAFLITNYDIFQVLKSGGGTVLITMQMSVKLRGSTYCIPCCVLQ
jgi:hypothetical protein